MEGIVLCLARIGLIFTRSQEDSSVGSPKLAKKTRLFNAMCCSVPSRGAGQKGG